MPNEWNTIISDTAAVYPLHVHEEKDGDVPIIGQPLDTGCLAELNDLRGPNLLPELRPLDAEILLDDVVDRLGNCMTIRNKAQDLEVLATTDALEYAAQKTIIEATSDLDSATAEINKQILTNQVSLKKSETEISPKEGIADELWEKQVQARDQQIEATRVLLEELRTRASQSGNGANYVERFSFLRKLFFYNVREAYSRARAASLGLKEIYGIDTPVPEVIDTGYLNKLVLWSQEVSDTLDRELDRRRIGILPLTLASVDENTNEHELLKKSEWVARIATKKVNFNISSIPFEWSGMKKPRVRGLNIRVFKGTDLSPIYWAAEIKLPSQKIGAIDYQVRTNMVVTRSEPDLNRSVQGSSNVFNANPIGDWELKFSDRSLTGQATSAAEITTAILFLKLSYEPA